jgi:hypothetical protein
MEIIVRWRVGHRSDKMRLSQQSITHNGRWIMNESSFDPFEQRRKGLEEAFFKERDQQLLARLQGELQSLEERQKIAHLLGITEEKVLSDLVQAGVRAETLAAVDLVPLVEVAWCDGSVADEERDAVLNAAVSQGIKPGSASHDLLAQWLARRPDPAIGKAWREYVAELARIMPKDSVATLKKKFVDRCTRVAAAAGGFLGLATISHREQAKIEELAKAWDA